MRNGIKNIIKPIQFYVLKSNGNKHQSVYELKTYSDFIAELEKKKRKKIIIF